MKEKRKGKGHQEVQGETIAMFEFYEHGFNPYSHYVDEDKVDLILRKRVGQRTRYWEVQVKFGRLWRWESGWQSRLFDVTSWRPMARNAFETHRPELHVAYVLSEPEVGYRGDIFIFPSSRFHQLVQSVQPGGSGKNCTVHFCRTPAGQWYLLRNLRKFSELTEANAVCVESYRRNFNGLLEAGLP